MAWKPQPPLAPPLPGALTRGLVSPRVPAPRAQRAEAPPAANPAGSQPPAHPGTPPLHTQPAIPPQAPTAVPFSATPSLYPGANMVKPRRTPRWAAWLLAGATAAAVLAGISMAVVQIRVARESAPTPPAQGQTQYGLGTAVVTAAIDPATKGPLGELETVSPATERIYAPIHGTVKEGSTLRIEWFINGQHAARADFEHRFSKDYSGWIAPYITYGGKPWPAGRYAVRYLLDGREVVRKEFEVRDSAR